MDSMRCAAVVENKHALSYRANGDDDPRCRREAAIGGLCYQHSAVRHCQARGCTNKAVRQEGDWWMCREHAPLWEDHRRIVNRILEIPCRPR